VLAADATHLYAHIDGGRIFPTTYMWKRWSKATEP